MPPFSLGPLFDGRHWMDPQPGPLSILHFVFAGLLALILVGLTYYYFFRARRRFGEHPFKMRLARRVATYGIVISLAGLVLLGVRYGGVPFLSLPALFYITVLVGLALAGYLGFFLWRRYPSRLAQYERRQLMSRYSPLPKGRSGRGAGSARRKDTGGKKARRGKAKSKV